MPKSNGWPTVPETTFTNSVVHWDKAFRDERSFYRVPVTCGKCSKERIIEASKTRGVAGKKFSGLCNSCRLKELNHFLGKNVDHPSWKGGRFNVGGYPIIQVSILTGAEREMAEKMCKRYANGTVIVAEHRLVIAMSLGRPLTSKDVVHHRNGIKTDNRIENLELTTHANHRRLDVKYYDLWQKALSEIAILKEQVQKLLNSSEGE